MNAYDECEKLWSQLNNADNIMAEIQKLFAMPYRPTPLMPISDAKRAVADLMEENLELKSKIARLSPAAALTQTD